MSIRIIAGECKGFMIKGDAGEGTRPILARVRKSLFDILMPYLADAVFLDLFCGTGAVGIEALSRGAEKLVAVELDKSVCNCVTQNLKYCKLDDKAEVVCEDVFEFLKNYSNTKFDIIFAGPPYPANLCNEILTAIDSYQLVKKSTLVILQHSYKEKISDDIGKLKKCREKKYGETILSFYKKRDDNDK